MADNAFDGDANPGSRLHRLRAWLARGSFVRYARMLMEQLRRLDRGFATRFPRLHHLLGSRAARAELLRCIWRRARPAALVAASLSMLVAVWFVYHVYLDRSGVPDFEEFVRFEVPGIGEVFDSKGRVLIELAHEYRRPVTYDEIPLVMRQAILSAEDKSFFKHSGVDYMSLPRMVVKNLRYTWEAWQAKREHSLNPVFRQGGSTLTQQLVRRYFLADRMAHENGSVLFPDGWSARVMSWGLGVPATNKLLRKVEEVRLTFWLEHEMERHFGSKQQAKREIFARYASFIYLGHGRYGFAASSEYYFGEPLASYSTGDVGRAAMLAGMAKSPGGYAPVEGSLAAMRRRNVVLALMARNGYITEDVMKQCQAEQIVTVSRKPIKTFAPAAIGNVIEELRQYGDPRLDVRALVEGRISIQSTVDERVQMIVNTALEDGLALYEKRHPSATGAIQGSVVVLRNRDGGVLAEAGGRQVYKSRFTRYYDLNRVTDSLRQPGSAFKPIVYFAAFKDGLDLESTVNDAPIGVAMGNDRGTKWISNYDSLYKGSIPMRVALAESRNAVAILLARGVGLDNVLGTARELGIKTPLQPYITTALGASEVRLMELANVYRALASGIITDAHVIEKVVDRSGNPYYLAPRLATEVRYDEALLRIQEGLRGVIRLPDGTAHSLDNAGFPIPVMGKTGTTSDFRDALFVGSTYGPDGITVAVRMGFDDNRPLGNKETGGRAALPIFRNVMLQIYQQDLVGAVPKFPQEIESNIDGYLAARAASVVPETDPATEVPPIAPEITPNPPR